jgi:DNA-binding transcriptional LysR family regulator
LIASRVQHRLRIADTERVWSGLVDLRLLRYFLVVCEEGHFGRAAHRLHMTQPPLSRAIKQLEADFGTTLLERGPRGVTVTATGAMLLDEARSLLAQADQAHSRVAALAGRATICIGILADSAETAGTRLATTFRDRHPSVDIQIRESDLSDPAAGLHTGLVDVALTRAPFDMTGITSRSLRSDPVGVILLSDDPLALRDSLSFEEVAGRRWARFPDTTDAAWCDYWRAGGAQGTDGPVVRTVLECLQAVLWNDTIGLAPLGHGLPTGLTAVPLVDFPSSRLVVAWPRGRKNPLVQSFVRIAAAAFRPPVRA